MGGLDLFRIFHKTILFLIVITYTIERRGMEYFFFAPSPQRDIFLSAGQSFLKDGWT